MSKTKHIIIKEFMVNSPNSQPNWLFIFAHGARNGMASPFMEYIAKALCQSNTRVVRFHFPYMEEMVRTGRKIAPNKGDALRQVFSEVVTHCIEKELCPRQNIILGGKSMGGRMASMIADQHGVAGVICFSYPFFLNNQSDQSRNEHLSRIRTPTLICQGARDPIGPRQKVKHCKLSSVVEMHWVKGANHNFTPSQSSGSTLEQNLAEISTAASMFIDRLPGSTKGTLINPVN